MGVASPRPTYLLVGGLVAVYLGWRVLDAVSALHLPLVFLGAACAIVATLWRLNQWRRADGDERSIATVFAVGSIGCIAALAAFVPSTGEGLDLLGMEFDRLSAEIEFRRVFTVIGPVLLSISLLPVLGAQWAVDRGGTDGSLPVDAFRVRGVSASALSLGLVGSGLMMAGYSTGVLDRTADFSYFKTSEPGEAVVSIVLGLEEPLEVALFFPPVNPVRERALGYFRSLARTTERVTVLSYDRFGDIQAAEEFGARRDGMIFLRTEGRTEEIVLPVELSDALSNLKTLDGSVQQALLLLVRERRFAYLTTGHGELNDPLGLDPEDDPVDRWLQDIRKGLDAETTPPPLLDGLRKLLAGMNYETFDLGMRDGLGSRVPDDAAMVLIVGPKTPFLDEEMNALGEYLDRGGSLLVALEPDSDFDFAALGDRLGLEYDDAMTVDDNLFVPERFTVADRRNIITNRFSTHPSVTTASRHGVRAGVLMVGPGRLTPVEGAEGVSATVTISSMASSFQDRNGDYSFNEGREERSSHGLAVAVEGRTETGDGASTVVAEGGEPVDQDGDDRHPPLRALVYADADIFSERVIRSQRMQWELVSDGVRWLGREEEFAGEVVSEEDVPIRHTNAEDVIWFYGIIFGAPTLVLAAGVVQYRRRRTPASRAEA
ncbi:MAG: Gldg family protein [Gemmatimonadetes bacterium]|nr:Gldg family protein [Gemmatimonadota bacterium]